MTDEDEFESIDGGKGGDKVGDLLQRLTAPFRENMARLWILGAGIILVILVFKSYTTLEPGQVAVRVNNITGAETTVPRAYPRCSGCEHLLSSSWAAKEHPCLS